MVLRNIWVLCSVMRIRMENQYNVKESLSEILEVPCTETYIESEYRK